MKIVFQDKVFGIDKILHFAPLLLTGSLIQGFNDKFNCTDIPKISCEDR